MKLLACLCWPTLLLIVVLVATSPLTNWSSLILRQFHLSPFVPLMDIPSWQLGVGTSLSHSLQGMVKMAPPIMLKWVYYAPQMVFTLVSIICLDKASCSLTIEDEECIIHSPQPYYTVSQWTPPRQLTEEDVVCVFQEMAGLRTTLRKHRCVKPIYLEIINLVRHLCIGVRTLTLTAWQKKPWAATASKPSLELGMLLGLLCLPHKWHGSPINVSLASCFERHSNYSLFSLYNHKTIIHGESYSRWHWSAQQSSNSF